LSVVTDAGPVLATSPVPRPGRELWLRVVSSRVMAPLAIAAAYLGGTLCIRFLVLSIAGFLWEWMALVAGARSPRAARAA
jgi:hypothetical protein